MRSAIALDAPVARAEDCDLEIRCGSRRPIPRSAPAGRLLASVDVAGDASSLTARPHGYVWRVEGICDFTLDSARRKVRVHLAPDVAEEVASLLLGSFFATLLSLNGRCVVHASAIEVGGDAVAFIGGSGSGKTTVAALCCIAGSRVLTDDVLRVEARADGAWCFSGSHALRLRSGTAALADHLDAAMRQRTLDHRIAVYPTAAGAGAFPIAAFVAPRWASHSTELRVERLRGSAALLELLRAPRTIGWVGTDQARSELTMLVDVVAAVPVYRAELPFEPRIDPRLGRELLERIGVQPGARAPLRS